jgi:hypothetical protein
MSQPKLMPQIRDQMIYILITFIFIIYLAFFMGEQKTWWGGATILLCIVIAIISIILIIQSMVAYYEAVEGDSKSYRTEELERENDHLITLNNNYKLQLTDGKSDVISKTVLRDILSNNMGWNDAIEKIRKELYK